MPRTRHRAAVWSLSVAAALAAGGCGGTNKQSANTASKGSVPAEAKSAASGDIPDNQVFLVFRNRAAGYSMKYPEGWTQAGTGKDVTFKDKNNVVQIAVRSAVAPTPREALTELAALKRFDRSLVITRPPRQVTVKGATMIKSGYSKQSAPDPVTSKRVRLGVDRYQLARNGKLATVELDTPQGVDNVDAYRLMIESFKWR
jgi:hypothetical protein